MKKKSTIITCVLTLLVGSMVVVKMTKNTNVDKLLDTSFEAFLQNTETGRLCADDTVYECVYEDEPWHAYRGVFF